MRMIEPVASGTSEDVEAVAPELAMLPGAVLQALHDQGVGVRVCRESVTDYRTDLIGRLPRGWPEGVDWSRVPGCYCPDERNVVIATIGTPDGRRVVPPKGIKHNAWNLVLHETMHADDYIAERSRCRNPYFLAAREADIDALTSYEARQGQAGYEETYAESAGRHFGQDPSLQLDCPALAEFWTATALPVDPGPPPTELVMETIGLD